MRTEESRGGVVGRPVAAHDRSAVKWHGLPRGLLARRDCCVENSLKCPLCQFMEDSPCAAVFKVWEASFGRGRAKNKESDKEKKAADFAVACAEPTLALKACVEIAPRLRSGRDVRPRRLAEAPPAAPAP